jgi:hypothetical protein
MTARLDIGRRPSKRHGGDGMRPRRSLSPAWMTSVLWVACVRSQPGSGEVAQAISSPPPVEAAASVSAPADSPDPFERALVEGRTAFDACYARARSDDPQLGRTSVEFTFRLDEAGHPMTVDMKYRHRMSETAKECMRDAAMGIPFPGSRPGFHVARLTFPAPNR